jgi:hypothetical protein
MAIFGHWVGDDDEGYWAEPSEKEEEEARRFFSGLKPV